MTFSVRPTTRHDIAALPAIEHAAGQRFTQIPELAWLAAGPVISVGQHQQAASAGMSWVVLAGDCPVGFLLAEAQDASLFIVEISLHRAWQGQGLGRRLIDFVATVAKERGFTSLTLTTFRQVSWNAPWYARMGFEILPEAALTAALRQKRQEESAHGLAYESRCAMRLMLD
ncbi:GNAT family N-acetyltransferase [Kluyvera cryocrescens]|uniref:Ribosomal-protein-alanine acetyltransferase n=1 Tax=Kluyvera cryocrescens TaxID=580 RepID=A0A485BAV4_KLUCR|nr:GNAT family N-acetyltransferase [Kluyvera cryocrescens]VFS70837.1 ribosomal-protein-alanine acetyltransferase [Kluyvera cryocrescens]